MAKCTPAWDSLSAVSRSASASSAGRSGTPMAKKSKSPKPADRAGSSRSPSRGPPFAAVEPEIAREDTRNQIRRFWATAAADGLLPADADLDWLAGTAAVLGAADTYLHLTRTGSWTPDEYEQWLLITWRRLLAAAATAAEPAPGGSRPVATG